MEQFAIIRLGKDSVSDIRHIDSIEGELEKPIILEVGCTQVPLEADIGTYCFVWLGSDNSKGQDTEWLKGLRAFGKILSKHGGPNYKDEWLIKLEINYVLKKSVTHKDLLAHAAYAYYWCSDMPIIGLSSYSNQTVQLLKTNSETQNVSALFYALNKVQEYFYEDFYLVFPELSHLLNYSPSLPDVVKNKVDAMKEKKIEAMLSEIESNQVCEQILDLVSRGSSSILLSGPPGTGKTWICSRIALKLAKKNPDCIKQIQFHPTYSYDDFIEGYVPSIDEEKSGLPKFEVRKKIFLNLCEDAINNPENTYVLIIDEFTRGDPSRIFGELLTFIEADYREVEFILPYSGKKQFIPKNIIILGTMNPYDKSVTDLDDAMERRFDKVTVNADVNTLKKLVQEAGMKNELMGKLIPFFNEANEKSLHGIGHAYFKNISDENDLLRLWNHKLHFMFEKMFRFRKEEFAAIRSSFTKLLSEEHIEKLADL